MAYVLKIPGVEDDDTFYIRIDPDTHQLEYKATAYEATRFDNLTEMDKTIEYCHIHGYEIEKVK